MKRVHKGISEIIIMVSGLVLLILVTVVGISVNKYQTKAAEKEAAELKKSMITPTPLPTNTPMPTATRAPTPTIKISTPSATLAPVASGSATISSTVKPTIAPTVKPSATPTKAP